MRTFPIHYEWEKLDEGSSPTVNNTAMPKPFVIDVEGIIGAGKTTIIEECLIPLFESKGLKVVLVKEPVDNWGEILPRFYKDPARWGYHFQTKAFLDRVNESNKMWDAHKDEADIFICERGVMSDTLFMKTLYEQGHVDDLEWKHYQEWWAMWDRVMPFSPDLFVYLTPTMDEVMRRVRLRARDGEEGVGREYQMLLKDKHDEMFDRDSVAMSPTNVVPIHRIETDSNFKDDESVKLAIFETLDDVVHSIRQSQRKLK